MDKIFNNRFLLRLQEWAQKLSANRFLSSLQGAMMSVIGLLMVGACALILNGICVQFGLYTVNDRAFQLINLPYEFTMNSIALWLVIFLAYNYAKALGLKSAILSAVDALICYLLLAVPSIDKIALVAIDGSISLGANAWNNTFFGAPGMFIGFTVVFLTVRIEKFCSDKDIRIKLPPEIPPFLQYGFANIIPLLISILFFLLLSAAVSILSGGLLNICTGFMFLLSAPLKALTSLWGMYILGIICTVFWIFGIHGTMVLMPIVMPSIMIATAENAAAFQSGGMEALKFYPVFLWAGVAMVGGTGNTWALSLLGLFSKSKQIKAVAKVSLLPGWFNVNEPVVFGMPIMYNPLLAIPYILNVPVVMFLTYLAFKVGFLIPAHIPVYTILPIGIMGYMSSLSWQNFIFQYLMIIPTALIWYPFYKVYEKQLLAKEKAQEASLIK